MGSDGHAYTPSLMRYLKDDWFVKRGGKLQDADKWNYFGAVNSVTQQKNVFHCGVFACMF